MTFLGCKIDYLCKTYPKEILRPFSCSGIQFVVPNSGFNVSMSILSYIISLFVLYLPFFRLLTLSFFLPSPPPPSPLTFLLVIICSFSPPIFLLPLLSSFFDSIFHFSVFLRSSVRHSCLFPPFSLPLKTL